MLKTTSMFADPAMTCGDWFAAIMFTNDSYLRFLDD